MLTNRAPRPRCRQAISSAPHGFTRKAWASSGSRAGPARCSAGALIYESGGTRFSLIESSGAASGTDTQLARFVDDVEAEVAGLKAKGVVFEEYDLPQFKTVAGIAESPSAKAAWFKDTESNLLALIQIL